MEVEVMPQLGMPELLINLGIFMLLSGVGQLPQARKTAAAGKRWE